MGFRFRKSIKLFPGLRLNFGLRGASVSLGVPGAMLNFSEHGARTTFGIPGTGFSWSSSSASGRLPDRYRSPAAPGERTPIETVAQLEEAVRDPHASVVYRGSGRRLSVQQLEAAHRRLANEERKQQAQAEIDRLEAELKEQLACWRDLPNLPSAADYQAAMHVQRFAYPGHPPRAPDMGAARAALDSAVLAQVESSTSPARLGTTYAVAGAGILCGAAVGLGGHMSGVAVARPLLIVVGLGIAVAGVLGGLAIRWVRARRRASFIEGEAARQAEIAWPQRAGQVAEAHAAAVASFERSRAEAEAVWLEAERARIAWASRLLAGEVEAIHAAVSESLEDLDFPFETVAEFAVETPREGYVHVDLPEIEDVLPETRFRVLADGRMKEVKRDAAERNAEYCELVCGVGVMIAAAAFAAAPTMSSVFIAAYTQREQKGKAKGEIGDDYVYAAAIDRRSLEGLDAARLNATMFMMRTAKMEQQANLRLKKLPAKDLPRWVADLGTASA